MVSLPPRSLFWGKCPVRAGDSVGSIAPESAVPGCAGTGLAGLPSSLGGRGSRERPVALPSLLHPGFGGSEVFWGGEGAFHPRQLGPVPG